jgi:GNAT superfamily N-acetyltransferase
MFAIRPFQPTDAEYTELVAVLNAVWTEDPTTVEHLRYQDSIEPPGYLRERLIVESDGCIVASARYGEMPWSYRPGKYFIMVSVLPAYRRRGIGSALYDQIIGELHRRDLPPTFLSSGTFENLPEGIRFLEKRGYKQVMRWSRSALEVAPFDPTPFAAVVQRVEAEGIHIYSLAELQTFDPDWQRKIYDLDWECTLDEPMPDAPTQMPLEQYVRQEFENPGFLPEGWFVALDGDVYAGMSVLHRHTDDPTRLGAGFTCVRRPYRRRGIATSLKLRGIAYAKEVGAAAILTGNEANNPMLQINLRLGFQPGPAELAYENRLEQSP